MPELRFIDPAPVFFRAAVTQLLNEGARRFLFTPATPAALTLARRLLEDAPDAVAWGDHPELTPPPMGEAADAVILFADDGSDLDTLLHGFLDMERGVLVAPVTNHFRDRRCVFPISPPKAGTHLLLGLLETLGFSYGGVRPDFPDAKHWYYLEYSNAHTIARDFFVDSVRRSPNGMRDHPFVNNPSVMIYRHPWDILVSEANYYHKDGKTAFYGYLQGLTFEERLLRLIDDPWLLGTARDRLAGFVAWLDFPSVIPIAFEDLVGPQGGGESFRQRRNIWALMLKLHVPGDPEVVQASVFNPKSPTFNTGRLGRHRDILTERAWEALRKLPQDVLDAFGYVEDTPFPRRSEEFLTRVPRYAQTQFAKEPVIMAEDFCGHQIIKAYGSFHAAALDGTEGTVSDKDLDVLKIRLATRTAPK